MTTIEQIDNIVEALKRMRKGATGFALRYRQHMEREIEIMQEAQVALLKVQFDLIIVGISDAMSLVKKKAQITEIHLPKKLLVTVRQGLLEYNLLYRQAMQCNMDTLWGHPMVEDEMLNEGTVQIWACGEVRETFRVL